MRFAYSACWRTWRLFADFQPMSYNYSGNFRRPSMPAWIGSGAIEAGDQLFATPNKPARLAIW